MLKKVLPITLLFTLLNADTSALLESEPEIIFQYDKIKSINEQLALQVDFNKAMMHLEKDEYFKAIPLLKKTAKILKIPSFLNLGIAYYKLNSYDNAKLYLEEINNLKFIDDDNIYPYMSSCYYLYKINNNEDYLDKIIKIGKNYTKLNEHAKRMLADTYIIFKEYRNALKVMDSMEFSNDLKKAILYLKIEDYTKSEVFLNRAMENNLDQSTVNRVVWLKIFRDLKANEIEKLKDNLDVLNDRKDNNYHSNRELPLKLYFNKKKHKPDVYLDKITNFDIRRKIDLVYYFAPFVFSDKDEIIYDSFKGFIFNSKQNMKSLDDMVKFNAEFIEKIKDDPIVRINKLKELAKKNPKSYVYYNLALSYTHISDFHNAYKYFRIAYKLNPGNKLFATMVLMTAIKIDKEVEDREYIEKIIANSKGSYIYFGQTLYKTVVRESSSIRVKESGEEYEDTIFYNALNYINSFNEKKLTQDEPLFKKFKKDPLVFLLNLAIKNEGESDYNYFSRLQDSIPLKYNDNFLDGPLVVTQFYLDFLRALGLFEKADLNIEGRITPSYLITKALRELYNKNPNDAIYILEFLQKKYKIEDRYTLYLYVASLLEAGRYNDASIQITLIKNILKDYDADFLTGVQLVQELKIKSARQYFKEPYKDTMIDFMLDGLDEYLESL